MNQPIGANSHSRKKVRECDEFDDVDHQSDEDEDEDEEDDLNEVDLWKKRSIFFELPYWEFNILCHNLNVIHIEKNVCENLIGTILNVDRKNKDNLKSRLDLVDMGIHPTLHPKTLPNGKSQMTLACFSMSKQEKDVFLKVLKDVKVPDAYASNISRYVNIKEQKLCYLK